MADSGCNSNRRKERGLIRGRGNNNNWRSNRWRGCGRGNGTRKNYNNNDSPSNHTSSSGERSEIQGQRNRINQHFPLVSCPFKGWKHYFPSEDFVPTSRTVQKIKWSIELFSHQEDICDFNAAVNDGGFPLDYKFLVENTFFGEIWPQFKDDLIDTPTHTLAVLSLAMYQLVVETFEKDENELSQKSKLTNNIPYIRARLMNYRKITPLKSLRAALFGKLVAVSGTCVRASNTIMMCVTLSFQCRTCSGVMTYPQTDGKYEPPARCILDVDGLQCTGNNFEPLRNSLRNVAVEWQSIRIQENSSENLEIGRIPRSVDCELMEDLVGTCCPGELVTLIGIIKAVNVNESNRGSKDANMFTFYIEAVSIQNQNRGNEAEVEDEPLSETTSSCNGNGLLTFNTKDYHAIRKIHEEPNLFAFLVASLCPSIYGNYLVKAGLLLGLFGGNNSPKFSSNKSPFSKRSDIHVLIVGDPGLGKSQMLHACSMVSPRGVLVCGNSTTNSGLTVTLTKDGKTNGNEYTLEAGALVLGDQGTCCIDEFDKMSGQHQALLEAMEQQSISLAKAGIVCTLPARTSILAAANPVGGHYNRDKTVSENIKLGPALLSRFDLVFLLLDRPDMAVDEMLTEHILALHTGKSTTNAVSWNSSLANSSSQKDEDTLKARLFWNDTNADLLPTPLLRKYIAYARQYVHPVLNEDAKREINDFYLQLRKSQYPNDSTPITPRQLESLVRLAQARAKAELRVEVTRQDARDVIELVKTSFDDVFKNEIGALDFSRSQNGCGMSSRNEGKRFVEFLQSYASKNDKTLFTLDELKTLATQCGVGQKGNFKQFIETLNHQNYLLNKGGCVYKLVT